MPDSILIMLASYNGEKYIGEQIESIIAQSYENWELIIQDDGSTDNTVDIVKSFCEKDQRIKLYMNETNDHGPFCNFWVLLNKVRDMKSFDYYMFSDQDDIWNNNKIEVLHNKYSDVSKPYLVFADMGICNENGEITDASMDSSFKMSKRDGVNVFFSHKIFGCNMMINRQLFQLIPHIITSDIRVKTLSHDNFISKYAVTFGGVGYVCQPTMLYRRHEKAVTGQAYYKHSRGYIARRLLKLEDVAKSHSNIYNQSLYAIASLLERSDLPEHQRKRLEEIKRAILKGNLAGAMFLVRRHVDCGRISENISRFIILLLGIHKKYLVCE